MKVYVEAYDIDGNQILGNCDGQRSWEGKRYKFTAWYRNLPWVYTLKRVAYYRIVTPDGKLIEKVIHELPEVEYA